MKKIITTILIAAAAFTACVQNDEVVVNNNGKVSFTASFDAPQTRTVLVNESGKFHAEWEEGDYIELFEVTKSGTTTAKANNPFVTLTAGGPTASVEFTLDAKTADEFTYIVSHNNASMNGAGTFMAFTLPAAQAPKALNTFDAAADLLISKGVVVAAQPTTGLTFELQRVTAIGEVTVKNLALAADDKVVSVAFTCSEDIAGKRTKMMVTDIAAGNDPLTQATVDGGAKGVTVTLPEAQTGDFTYYMNVWPATLAAGSEYTVVVTTEKDQYIKTGTLAAALAFTSGNITAFTVNMSGVKGESEGAVDAPKYVEVAGIKWATGNLQYQVAGTADEGFATGWRIAPAQWHYFKYQTSGDIQDTITEWSSEDYFNWGGIENPLTRDAAYSILAAYDANNILDISAKMYTDQACTTETTDYAAAKYGDIAYWASNGQYRMPTGAEMDKLVTECDVKFAKYTTIDGATINGYYITDPAEGATPVVDIATQIDITDEDLAKGLFLPRAGRRYDVTSTHTNAEYNIYKLGAQCWMRTSTIDAHSTTTTGYGVIGIFHNVADIANFHKYNKAYGATGRYTIRPVYIAQ
ncbi:MAG: hypothetical protein IJX65_00980 [Alistipes sp.]|nr:hypothetical protein [Alistipes sp.]